MSRLIITTLACGLSFLALASSSAQEREGGEPSVERPTVSPDGRSIVFESNAGRSLDIWRANRDGSEARPLIVLGGSDEMDPEWLPDGRRLVFVSNRSGFWNIWSATSSGVDLKPVTDGDSHDSHPRVSPDGTAVAFVSDRSGRKGEIWIVDAAGGVPQRVAGVLESVEGLSWSPDGLRFVYSGCDDSGCRLYLISRDGGHSVSLTNEGFEDWSPDWSEQGIVFASNRGGAVGIWFLNADGSGLRQLSETGFDPSWDAAGRVVFVTAGRGSFTRTMGDAWDMAETGGVAIRLTNIEGYLASGDVNGDAAVNCLDLGIVKAAFGKRFGQAGYDSRADIDANGLVDVRDIGVVSRNTPTGLVCR